MGLGYWIAGLLAKFVSTAMSKMDQILLKPLFHHSNTPLFHEWGLS
jgi:hypothetical protein